MLANINNFKIENNKDWNDLENLSNLEETLVDISNNAYFGYRAMEKGAKYIIYDPTMIDSLVRIVKNAKKFKDTIHVLILDSETLGYESKKSNEAFLKTATRLIESILDINPLLCIEFKIKTGSESNDETINNVLNKIYKK